MKIISSIIATILLFFITVIFTECKKGERLMYKNAPLVYFSGSVPAALGDSLPYSFVVRPDTVTKDTVTLRFRISGFAADKDRSVNVQIDQSTTAKQGTHFDISPAVIKAGSYTAEMYVILHRTPDLKEKTFLINLVIDKSPEFDVGLGNSDLRIFVTDQLLMPSDWPDFIYGPYSRVKHQFMVEHLNSIKITESLGAQLSEMLAILQKMRLELLKYESVNGPLMDENGERVTFPSF
ncbi:DUF4843 domain-containing protein [Chitinophaga sp. 212800010-3]|uniref:DUF4843 domain-containing protein n=1 Tax=unclassified Chitinophaga TaxID=2619133 RepID=UPI002DECE8C5|nr:DUF4843 domain-containing protein [Chitinophaga sp. 212800010-3]